MALLLAPRPQGEEMGPKQTPEVNVLEIQSYTQTAHTPSARGAFENSPLPSVEKVFVISETSSLKHPTPAT